MNRMLVGAFGALILVAIGLFWWQGRAIEAEGLPPPEAIASPERKEPEPLPTVEVADMQGPELPTAVKMSDEQRRFARYDINRDLIITRNEMLSTRVSAFRRLDKDGNNLLTFEEWAVTTVTKFEGADANGDGRLTPDEFRTTAPKRKPARRCAC
ncbi:EF-hand domain-containing protein [Croceicoccus bisphenolivorans]|uniref:EF-hand domain-containing protein n=1 Tax=Croceicoccus bisphenolivorans TaxID=1783232 RepID=UPI0008370C9A|nr:EF-hand domain-containing protein [Croceicoccus bisphenolivorans]